MSGNTEVEYLKSLVSQVRPASFHRASLDLLLTLLRPAPRQDLSARKVYLHLRLQHHLLRHRRPLPLFLQQAPPNGPHRPPRCW